MSDGMMRIKEEYLAEAERDAEDLVRENYNFIKQKVTGYPNLSSVGIEKYKKIVIEELRIILAVERSLINIETDVIREKIENPYDVNDLISKYDRVIKESKEKEKILSKQDVSTIIKLKYAMLGGFGAAYIQLQDEIGDPKNAQILKKCRDTIGKITIGLPESIRSLLIKDQVYIVKVLDFLEDRAILKTKEEKDFGLLYAKFIVTKLRYDMQQEDLRKVNPEDKVLQQLRKLRLQLNGIAIIDMAVEDIRTNRKVGEATSNAELLAEIEQVEWSDVVGQEDAKKTLRDSVVRFLGTYDHTDKSSIFENVLSTKPPKAILLYGPPGTGKTYMLKAVITESERIRDELIKVNKLNPDLAEENKRIYFNLITPDQIKDKYIGESAKAIKGVFSAAKKEAPSLLVIDEIDAFFSKRGDRGFNEGEREIVSVLMQELDGIKNSDGYILIGITNMPKTVDKAILSRFERKIEFKAPRNPEEVTELFRVYLRNLNKSNSIPKMSDEDWKKLGEVGYKLGFTGRLIKQFVRTIEQERNDILTELYGDNKKVIDEYFTHPEKMKKKLSEKSDKFTISYLTEKMGEFATHNQHSESYGIE